MACDRDGGGGSWRKGEVVAMERRRERGDVAVKGGGGCLWVRWQDRWHVKNIIVNSKIVMKIKKKVILQQEFFELVILSRRVFAFRKCNLFKFAFAKCEVRILLFFH